jgi:hypothetical protein
LQPLSEIRRGPRIGYQPRFWFCGSGATAAPATVDLGHIIFNASKVGQGRTGTKCEAGQFIYGVPAMCVVSHLVFATLSGLGILAGPSGTLFNLSRLHNITNCMTLDPLSTYLPLMTILNIFKNLQEKMTETGLRNVNSEVRLKIRFDYDNG